MDDPSLVEQLREWTRAIDEAFATLSPHDRTKQGRILRAEHEPRGVGTAALRTLANRSNGGGAVEEQALSSLIEDACDLFSPDVDSIDANNQRALAYGGAAWLYVPKMSANDWAVVFPGDPIPKRGADGYKYRGPWAESTYQSRRVAAAQLDGRGRRAADYRRAEFRDALRDAVCQHIRRLGGDATVPRWAGAAQSPMADPAFISVADNLDHVVSSASPISSTALAEELTLSSFWYERRAESEQGLYSAISPTRGGQPGVDLLLSGRNAVVLGDPGSGKSTLLRAAVITSLRRESQPSLFIRCADLAADLREHSSQPSDPGAIVQLLVSAADRSMFTLTASQFEVGLRSTQLPPLVALDGLDEVETSIERQSVLSLVSALTDLRVRVVISSRIAGYRSISSGFDHYIVDRLSQSGVDLFFANWFSGNKSAGFERLSLALERSSELRELVTLPVMATIAAVVADYGDVPNSFAGLYERYVEHYLQRDWKGPAVSRSDPFEIDRLKRAAAGIAWSMATLPSGDREVPERWADSLVMRELAQLRPESNEMLRTLVNVDGMLTTHGRRLGEGVLDQTYRWIHRTLHEHLVGWYLADLRSVSGQAVTDRWITAAQNPRVWSVPLQHAIALMSPSAQMEIVLALDAAQEEGDPDEAIGTSLYRLDEVLDESVRRRSSAYARSLTAAVRAAGVHGAEREILAALESGVATAETVSELRKIFDLRLVRSSTFLVEQVLRWGTRVGVDGWNLKQFLDHCVGRRVPESAWALLTERGHANTPFGGPHDLAWKDWLVEEEELKRLVDEAERAEGLLESLPFVTLLVLLADDSFIARASLSQRSREAAALARRWLDWATEISANDRRLLEPMWLGLRGPEVAWLAGAMTFPRDDFVASLPLMVGWARTAFHVNFATSSRSILDLTLEPLSQNATSKVFRDFRVEIDRRDLGQAELLLRACRQVWDGERSTGVLDPLIKLCVDVSRTIRDSESRYEENAPAISLTDLRQITHSALDRFEWGDVFPRVAPLWLAADNADRQIYSDIIEMFIPDQEERLPGAEHRADELIAWGVEVGVEVLPALPAPLKPSLWMREAISLGLTEYLRLPLNMQRIARWLSQEGSLAQMRTWFLSR